MSRECIYATKGGTDRELEKLDSRSVTERLSNFSNSQIAICWMLCARQDWWMLEAALDRDPMSWTTKSKHRQQLSSMANPRCLSTKTDPIFQYYANPNFIHAVKSFFYCFLLHHQIQDQMGNFVVITSTLHLTLWLQASHVPSFHVILVVFETESCHW